MRRVVEFLLVGGGTIVLFPLAFLLRKVVGLDDAELTVGFLTFYGAYVINDPHFAVTYLLFYKDVRRRARGEGRGWAQRARYVMAGFVVPVVLAVWAVVSIARHSGRTLGWMVQLFFAAFFVAVSIHHYAMDNAIWRRDNPDTRFLRESDTLSG